MPAAKHNLLAVILGGGAGSRLFPLTQLRSKPAVPLGGKYRLVDIPISNCINSDVHKIFVLTQYNSASLNRHIAQTYRFSQFSNGFVEARIRDDISAVLENKFLDSFPRDALGKRRHAQNAHLRVRRPGQGSDAVFLDPRNVFRPNANRPDQQDVARRHSDKILCLRT